MKYMQITLRCEQHNSIVYLMIAAKMMVAVVT